MGPSQWELPREEAADGAAAARPPESDFDLVEAAFVEGFAGAGDAPSFLRLAGVPFVGEAAGGARLHLLRVELDEKVDVASLSPALGGGAVRYAPLPARLTDRRRRLRFVYHDGKEARRLSLAEARGLSDRTEATAGSALPLG